MIPITAEKARERADLTHKIKAWEVLQKETNMTELLMSRSGLGLYELKVDLCPLVDSKREQVVACLQLLGYVVTRHGTLLTISWHSKL